MCAQNYYRYSTYFAPTKHHGGAHHGGIQVARLTQYLPCQFTAISLNTFELTDAVRE